MKKSKYLIFATLSLIVLLSGCVSVTETPSTTGRFVLLISDAEADIGDFDSLLVTFSKARIFKPGNESGSGFEEFPFNATVDMTQVVGEKSVEVLEVSLEEGTYSKIELYASEVKGLVGGEEVEVTVPSDKLQIVRPFEIKAEETTKFVFDINVVKKGQTDEYNLLPVIGKSGVVGKDLKEEEVEEEECTVDADCGENEVCINGECIEVEEEPECTVDEDCEEGEICVDNECKKNKTVSMTGDFILLVSDKEADIADFDSLIVSFSKARVFESEDDTGFEDFSMDASVDLTQVVGEKAISVLEVSLEEGRYTKVELHVSEVNGTVNGNSADVKVPSDKLRIVRPFEIKAGETTKFVFDIHVVKNGQKDEYNLLPVIGKSGVVGKDVPDDDVNETECTVDEDCGENETCVEGECIETEPECEEDSDCAQNQTCVNGTCTEIQPECINDSDCEVNETCVNGTCTEIEPECTGNQTRICYTGPPETEDVGLCHGGLEYCENNEWNVTCVDEVTPVDETCNNEDDDCDGETDEGNPGGGASCDTGEQGICADGTEQCVNGEIQCVRDQEPTEEICDDQLDNNCDGTVDEGC
jgi:hypothetical protein